MTELGRGGDGALYRGGVPLLLEEALLENLSRFFNEPRRPL